jgi:hypothetical protein
MVSAFLSVRKLVSEWQPGALPSERKYRDSLIAFLRGRLNNATIEKEYRHSGTTADIYVKESHIIGSTRVFVELKRNLLRKAELDRLVGQIECLQPRRNSIIVVLCGQTNPTLVARFEDQYNTKGFRLGGEGIALIVKEAAATAHENGATFG